jgi:hypothetical protein
MLKRSGWREEQAAGDRAAGGSRRALSMETSTDERQEKFIG